MGDRYDRDDYAGDNYQDDYYSDDYYADARRARSQASDDYKRSAYSRDSYSRDRYAQGSSTRRLVSMDDDVAAYSRDRYSSSRTRGATEGTSYGTSRSVRSQVRGQASSTRSAQARSASRQEGSYTSRLRDTGQTASRRTSQAGSHASARSNRASYSSGSDRSSAQTRRSASGYASQTPRLQATPKKRMGKVKIALIALAAILVIAGIGIFIYLRGISDNLHAGVTEDLKAALVETDMSKEPFYMLLIGADGSQERDEVEGQNGITRSDSMILARIDAPNKKVTLISLHRDTMTDMGEYGLNKLNAAHALEGAGLTVEMVSKLAGVDISHYAEINFDAFVAVVDALGGVEVNVPITFDDPDAGGALDAGWQTLNGEDALILCRARHAYDDIVGDGDEMRAANQRMVLGAIAHKLLESDIATIANTVRIVSQYVTTDLGLNDIIGLAQALQGFDPDYDLYSAMQPVEPLYEDDIWWAVTVEPDWSNMMARVKQGLPPTTEAEVDEATGIVLATTGSGSIDTSVYGLRISVRNGTDRSGLGAEAAEILRAAGYTNLMVGNANSTDYKETMVVYPNEGRAADAQQIVDDLGQGKIMENDGDYIIEGSFLLVIGDDWVSNK